MNTQVPSFSLCFGRVGFENKSPIVMILLWFSPWTDLMDRRLIGHNFLYCSTLPIFAVLDLGSWLLCDSNTLPQTAVNLVAIFFFARFVGVFAVPSTFESSRNLSRAFCCFSNLPRIRTFISIHLVLAEGRFSPSCVPFSLLRWTPSVGYERCSGLVTFLLLGGFPVLLECQLSQSQT